MTLFKRSFEKCLLTDNMHAMWGWWWLCTQGSYQTSSSCHLAWCTISTPHALIIMQEKKSNHFFFLHNFFSFMDFHNSWRSTLPVDFRNSWRSTLPVDFRKFVEKYNAWLPVLSALSSVRPFCTAWAMALAVVPGPSIWSHMYNVCFKQSW